VASNWLQIADVQAYLGGSNAAEQAPLTPIVAAVPVAIESYCSRLFQPGGGTITQRLNGMGGVAQYMPNNPILGVTSLSIDGQSIPASSNPDQNTGYWNDSLFIYLNGYIFTYNWQNVLVSYSYGYATTPADVYMAAIEIAAEIYRNRDHVGMTSKAMGGETTAFAEIWANKRVQQMLEPYRRSVPA